MSKQVECLSREFTSSKHLLHRNTANRMTKVEIIIKFSKGAYTIFNKDSIHTQRCLLFCFVHVFFPSLLIDCLFSPFFPWFLSPFLSPPTKILHMVSFQKAGVPILFKMLWFTSLLWFKDATGTKASQQKSLHGFIAKGCRCSHFSQKKSWDLCNLYHLCPANSFCSKDATAFQQNPWPMPGDICVPLQTHGSLLKVSCQPRSRLPTCHHFYKSPN